MTDRKALHSSSPSRATINLSSCQHNLLVAKQAAPNSKCIAIIKSNAYGHGMLKVAKALTDADAFGVAHLAEAIALREAGITQPILLLEGFIDTSEFSLVKEYKLDSVIHTEEQVRLLEESSGANITVFIKVDSGMHRLGFNPNEVADVVGRLDKCGCINHTLNFMTHFANADDRHDAKTIEQIETFYKTIEEFSENKMSMANSAAILGWPQSHATWNRPGIMLYGVSPFINSHADDHELKPVMTLSSRLISIKKLKAGDAIGYGGTYVCEKDKTIGVVAIGYGDGYPRHAKTGTPVLVNGKRCSLLGRVSMDMICVDLSDHTEAKNNDPVVLWGEGLAVEEVAEYADTIAYELLCGVTKRVSFTYVD